MTYSHGENSIKREFARRLRAALDRKHLSQSDLARAMYGEDERGGANKRYQIGGYVHGHSLPRTKILQAMCRALGVTKEDLLPRGRSTSEALPMLSFEQITPTTARLAIPLREISMAKAVKIMAILSESNE